MHLFKSAVLILFLAYSWRRFAASDDAGLALAFSVSFISREGWCFTIDLHTVLSTYFDNKLELSSVDFQTIVNYADLRDEYACHA